MRHTPGPWTPQTYTDGRISILHSVKADSALVLADMVHTGREAADARLIAAAPDMLAALEVLTGFVESLEGSQYVPKEHLKLARTTLRKLYHPEGA